MVEFSEEKLKASFENVRKDMEFFKNEIELVKRELLSKKEDKKVIEFKIKEILGSLNEIKDKLAFFYKISSGNNGVINNHQQSSTIINQNQSLEIIKKEFEELFSGLTDREFSVFMTIYQLEEELGQGFVRYQDVSKILKLTEISIRNYVNSMINKGIPINKTRQYNKKVSLSIKKELKELNLASKLLKLRQSGPNTQISLFDNH
ncbi:hypothetical protein HY500_02820 [Candidatus Woesearchaeota archaeon]|nr:hypothetical protein [Candidatus Woesearchaeota archaeon]